MALHLEGEIFGNLKVIEKSSHREFSGGTWRTFWICKCLCGSITEKTTSSLRSSRAISCGCCQWHIKHKDAYISWQSMKSRCDNPKDKDYPRYGGKGITYDIKWIKFTEFYKDMSDPPYIRNTNIRLTLDRINNNGNYTKENCRWATLEQQQNNRNNNYCIV